MEEKSIDITLSVEQQDNILVAHLLFFNSSARKYYLDKYTICYDGEFTRNVFSILDDKENKVIYIGPMAKRHVTPEDFLSLDSGESVKTRVVLNNGYRLRKGNKYTIQYSVFNLDYLRVQELMLIESNVVEVDY